MKMQALMDYVTASSTAIMAIFTVAMWRMVGNQLRDYETKERAWMLMEFQQHVPITHADTKSVRFTGDVRNFGETPATIHFVQHRGRILKREESLPSRPFYLDESPIQAQTIIVPKGGVPMNWDITQMAMDEITKRLRIFTSVAGSFTPTSLVRSGRLDTASSTILLWPGAANHIAGSFQRDPPNIKGSRSPTRSQTAIKN